MCWVITGGNTYTPMDSDAAAYIAAVEGVSGDNQALEPAVRCAIDQFVLGCKTDGIWTAIKASCILAGARTRLGALVPLVGGNPTPEGFVDGDYNRKTGLLGDGTTKSLNSNRNRNADLQNSFHQSVYVSTYPSSGLYMIGDAFGTTTGAGWSGIYRSSATNTVFVNRYETVVSEVTSQPTGLLASSRSSNTSFVRRLGGSSLTVNANSGTPSAVPIRVFSSSAGAGNTAAEWSNARLAFYSIGESLNLALLDARVTDLINAFAAAIP